jgi:hypothetical protein
MRGRQLGHHPLTNCDESSFSPLGNRKAIL